MKNLLPIRNSANVRKKQTPSDTQDAVRYTEQFIAAQKSVYGRISACYSYAGKGQAS